MKNMDLTLKNKLKTMEINLIIKPRGCLSFTHLIKIAFLVEYRRNMYLIKYLPLRRLKGVQL